MSRFINIAIDGPSASGKGAVSKGLSAKLGIPMLDTGAIYRAVTVYLIDRKIDVHDEKKVQLALARIDMRVFATGNLTKVFLAGRDVSLRIRDNEISIATPVIAAYPGVREFANAKIAEIAEQSDFIVEGRDIGTAVLPHAKYKFFLTASTEERAKRRMRELKAKGEDVSMVDMMIQVKARDEQDMNRAVAPLRQAADAVFVDSTDLTIEQTIDTIAKYIKL